MAKPRSPDIHYAGVAGHHHLSRTMTWWPCECEDRPQEEVKCYRFQIQTTAGQDDGTFAARMVPFPLSTISRRSEDMRGWRRTAGLLQLDNVWMLGPGPPSNLGRDGTKASTGLGRDDQADAAWLVVRKQWQAHGSRHKRKPEPSSASTTCVVCEPHKQLEVWLPDEDGGWQRKCSRAGAADHAGASKRARSLKAGPLDTVQVSVTT